MYMTWQNYSLFNLQLNKKLSVLNQIQYIFMVLNDLVGNYFNLTEIYALICITISLEFRSFYKKGNYVFQ